MQWILWLAGAWNTFANLTPVLNIIPFFNGEWLNSIVTFFFRGS